MLTHKKKRIDIVVEAPLLGRVIALLDQIGVSGYTVVPALAGRGKDGPWHRDGLVGRAGSMVLIFTIIDESRVDAVVEPLFKLVSRQIGVLTVCDVEVLRSEHF
jgi:nitrogen regulatory protein PII